MIPARHASTRLPGKPLLEIGGRPMIEHVVARARASGADEVVVATDDERIAGAVRALAASVRAVAVMTDPGLPSGTDRVAAVARERGWAEATIVVNVQGDEPFVPPALIDQAARLLARDATAAIATLATPVASLGEFLDPNVVKVVRAADETALYFSRAPIPWPRDAAAQPGTLWNFPGTHADPGAHGALQGRIPECPLPLRHVGLYAYRVGALARITALPPSALEACEKLEQLRALQAGLRIVVGLCEVAPAPGVDTPHDLERARARMARAAPGDVP